MDCPPSGLAQKTLWEFCNAIDTGRITQKLQHQECHVVSGTEKVNAMRDGLVLKLRNE